MSEDLKKLIPENYSVANLYIDLNKNSNKRTLTFYAWDKDIKDWFYGDVICEIEFETFNSAYKFILENEIEVYNISQGSYAKEIQKYNKNILETGQLTLL